MRLTGTCLAQHIGRGFQRKWIDMRNRKVYEYGSAQALKEAMKDVEIEDANEFVARMENKPTVKKVSPPKGPPQIGPDMAPAPEPELKPELPLQDRMCKFYRHNVTLVEGVPHALALTNSALVKVGEGRWLPPALGGLLEKASQMAPHDLVQRSLLQARVFDATQVKMPRIFDETFWRHYLEYAIPKERANSLMMRHLLQLCSNIAPGGTRWVRGGQLSAFAEKEGNLIGFQLCPDLLVAGKHSLYSDDLHDEEAAREPLPDIYPIKPMLNLLEEDRYDPSISFPLQMSDLYPHAHLAVFLQNAPVCKLTESQFGAATIASACGVALGQLCQGHEAPAVVQVVQTDGRLFQFAILCLHSRDLSPSSPRNLLWMSPQMAAYEVCQYQVGRPVLAGYNPQVFDYLLTFYLNAARHTSSHEKEQASS